MNEKPLITVVVPIYNVEVYLEQCIRSVLAQTYENFELLLVDDGSKDKSGEIVDRLAQTDRRIVPFHQKNQGGRCGEKYRSGPQQRKVRRLSGRRRLVPPGLPRKDGGCA